MCNWLFHSLRNLGLIPHGARLALVETSATAVWKDLQAENHLKEIDLEVTAREYLVA